MGGRVKYQTTKTTTNENGETVVNESKTIAIKADPVSPFFMVQEEFAHLLYNIKGVNDFKVLVEFATIMHFLTNEVELPSKKREELCERLKISTAQLSRSIKNLKKLGLLVGDGGKFKLIELVFWKGNIAKWNSYVKNEKPSILKEFYPDKEVIKDPMLFGSPTFYKEAA
jgi:hypothetical protein